MASIWDMIGGGQSADDGEAASARPSLGQLMGGPRDSIVEPIVGKEGLKAARMQGLLALGASLLQSSGYSRMPISTGQALGAGIAAMQQGYANSLDTSLKGALTAQDIQSKQLSRQRQLMLLRMASGIMGDQPGGGEGAPATPGPGAAPMGAPAPGAAAPGPMTAGMSSNDLPPPAAAAVAAADPQFSKRRAMGMQLLDPEHATAYQNIYNMANPELQALPDGTVVNMRDQSLRGTNHAALPPGMIRTPDGLVINAPGFAAAQATLQMNAAAAEHSQDLVDVVVPGRGTVKVPRASLGMQVTVGPNGQPTLSLSGGPQGGAFMSAEDPAALKEREGNVGAFLAAKKEAGEKATAAQDALAQLDNIDGLIKAAKPGFGQTAQYEAGRVLDSLGVLKGDASKWVDNAKQFQMQQKQQVLTSLKSLFPGRISNMEMNSTLTTMGNLDDPMNAVLMANDIKRVAAQRMMERSDFLQGYGGDRGKYETSWRNSANGQKSLYDYPQMWKHLPVVTGKQGTPVAGQKFVKTPGGNIYRVELDADGYPVPAGGQ